MLSQKKNYIYIYKTEDVRFFIHLIILYHISFGSLVILHAIFLINIFQLRLNFLLLKLSIYIYTPLKSCHIIIDISMYKHNHKKCLLLTTIIILSRTNGVIVILQIQVLVDYEG